MAARTVSRSTSANDLAAARRRRRTPRPRSRPPRHRRATPRSCWPRCARGRARSRRSRRRTARPAPAPASASSIALGCQITASARASAARWRSVSVGIVSVGGEQRLVTGRLDRLEAQAGLADAAVVRAGTAQTHELGGDGVERSVERDDPHELLERAPEVAGRRVGCGSVRRGEDAFERDAAPLEHVDHVERLHEREGVGAHRRAERARVVRRWCRTRRPRTARRRRRTRRRAGRRRSVNATGRALELLRVGQGRGHRHPDRVEHLGLHRACGQRLDAVEAVEGGGGVVPPRGVGHGSRRYYRPPGPGIPARITGLELEWTRSCWRRCR